MSIDRSLRVKSSLQRHRNVLKRAERISLLEDKQTWEESDGVLGLPKVGHRKVKAAGKVKAKAEEATEATADDTLANE